MIHVRPNAESRALKLRRNRSGQSLVLFIFLLIALMGVLALTLDFGFVILSRRHMQTGVNAAAKAGMRGEGLSTELSRRTAARTALRLSFDDDFDLSANSTTIGAGIDTSLIQGSGYQSTTIGPPGTSLNDDLANRSAFIYRPDDFELNTGNATHGDIVTGGYTATAPHDENSSYTRSDFSPSGSGSVLVRMRRTHDPDGLDDVSGVSSGSGGLPVILARAGWMGTESGTAPYSIRRDGVTVRATAIADGVAARAVGVANTTTSFLGAAPIAMTLTQWQSLRTSASFVPISATTGQVSNGSTINFIAKRVDATSARFVSEPISTVEQSWPDTEFIPTGINLEYFAPIYGTITSASTGVSEELIYGFVSVQLSRSGSTYSVFGRSAVTAPDNASALPPVTWQQQLITQLLSNPTYVSLSAANQATAREELITQVFANGTSLAAVDEGLRAPALVRSIH